MLRRFRQYFPHVKPPAARFAHVVDLFLRIQILLDVKLSQDLITFTRSNQDHQWLKIYGIHGFFHERHTQEKQRGCNER